MIKKVNEIVKVNLPKCFSLKSCTLSKKQKETTNCSDCLIEKINYVGAKKIEGKIDQQKALDIFDNHFDCYTQKDIGDGKLVDEQAISKSHFNTFIEGLIILDCIILSEAKPEEEVKS